MSSQLSRSFLKHKKKFNSNIKKFMYDLTIDNSFAQNNLLNYPDFTKFRDNSELQRESLEKIIKSIIEDNNLLEFKKSGKGQVWYLFANAVASFSNHNHFYWLSTGAKKILKQNKIDYNMPNSRSKIFNLRENGTKLLTFEHMCPASSLIEILLKNIEKIRTNPDQLRKFLREYGIVCIITKKEGEDLDNKYKNKLPDGKDPLERMLMRYENSKINIEEVLVPVYGKMYR